MPIVATIATAFFCFCTFFAPDMSLLMKIIIAILGFPCGLLGGKIAMFFTPDVVIGENNSAIAGQRIFWTFVAPVFGAAAGYGGCAELVKMIAEKF